VRRIIETEAWAIASPKSSPIGELTTRRLPQDVGVL
jgi:hypothetical protein